MVHNEANSYTIDNIPISDLGKIFEQLTFSIRPENTGGDHNFPRFVRKNLGTIRLQYLPSWNRSDAGKPEKSKAIGLASFMDAWHRLGRKLAMDVGKTLDFSQFTTDQRAVFEEIDSMVQRWRELIKENGVNTRLIKSHLHERLHKIHKDAERLAENAYQILNSMESVKLNIQKDGNSIEDFTLPNLRLEIGKTEEDGVKRPSVIAALYILGKVHEGLANPAMFPVPLAGFFRKQIGAQRQIYDVIAGVTEAVGNRLLEMGFEDPDAILRESGLDTTRNGLKMAIKRSVRDLQIGGLYHELFNGIWQQHSQRTRDYQWNNRIISPFKSILALVGEDDSPSLPLSMMECAMIGSALYSGISNYHYERVAPWEQREGGFSIGFRGDMFEAMVDASNDGEVATRSFVEKQETFLSAFIHNAREFASDYNMPYHLAAVDLIERSIFPERDIDGQSRQASLSP